LKTRAGLALSGHPEGQLPVVGSAGLPVFTPPLRLAKSKGKKLEHPIKKAHSGARFSRLEKFSGGKNSQKRFEFWGLSSIYVELNKQFILHGEESVSLRLHLKTSMKSHICAQLGMSGMPCIKFAGHLVTQLSGKSQANSRLLADQI
jgi:hypothetical protein